jgi:hypothetical protein
VILRFVGLSDAESLPNLGSQQRNHQQSEAIKPPEQKSRSLANERQTNERLTIEKLIIEKLTIEKQCSRQAGGIRQGIRDSASRWESRCRSRQRRNSCDGHSP